MSSRWRNVGEYRTLRGATLAVDHLVESGIRPAEVSVAPSALELDDLGRSRPPERVHPAISRLAGVALIVALGVVVAFGAPFVVAAPLALAAALLGATTLSWRVRRQRRRVIDAASTVRARQFAVLCGDHWRLAERRLARWWDPEAVPAERASPAPSAAG